MFHIQEHRVPRMLVYLIFILIYSATLALAQFCGQVTGNHLSYLYSYSYNDSSESLYAPGITADDSLLSCQKTEDAAVLKKETVMCNHLCALKLIPIVKIGNNSNVFNYTSEDDIPEGFEVISSLGPIYCARRHLHCGATKPLYWDTKTGELTLSNEFDSSAVALCYVWTNDSSQYKELTQKRKSVCNAKSSRKKRQTDQESTKVDSQEADWKVDGTDLSLEDTELLQSLNTTVNVTKFLERCRNDNNITLDCIFGNKRNETDSEEATEALLFKIRNLNITRISSSSLEPSTISTTVSNDKESKGTTTKTSTTTNPVSKNKDSIIQNSTQKPSTSFWFFNFGSTINPELYTRRRIRDLSNEINETSSSSTSTQSSSTLSSSSSTLSSSSSTTSSSATTTKLTNTLTTMSSNISTTRITTVTSTTFTRTSQTSLNSSLSTRILSSTSTTVGLIFNTSISTVKSTVTSTPIGLIFNTTSTTTSTTSPSINSSPVMIQNTSSTTTLIPLIAQNSTVSIGPISTTRLTNMTLSTIPSTINNRSSASTTRLPINITAATVPSSTVTLPSTLKSSFSISITNNTLSMFTNKTSITVTPLTTSSRLTFPTETLMTIANTTYIPKSSTYTIPTITSPTILNTPILTNAVTTNKISLLTNTNTLLPSVTNSTIQTVITATDPISSQTKTLLCEKLTELKQSNNISLQAVTYILSQYNISLTEAASLLNVPLLQLSTMSVAQIEGLVSSTCQEYGTAALSSGSASQSSNTTYIPNNQSYNSSRSTYNNTSGYSGHRGGQNRGSFSNDDRYDRENDYSDYWYDGTEYKYNHRVWRWVLLGVFCALCIAVAFALLCFACYRPYHSPTPTVVTPLPVTEKIYTTNGQIEVPPLPISPMPAYSNAATLRI